MPSAYDIAYAALVGTLAPWFALSKSRRAKVADAWRLRTGDVARREGDRPCVLIHAVSVGEVGAARHLVAQLRQQEPGWEIVVSVTTTTGFAHAQRLFGDDSGVRVERFPIDFSRSVGRFVDRLRPSVVMLMELEVWPNFLRICRQRGVPVLLGNGRITTKSFAGYRKLGPVARSMFGQLAATLAQEPTYADRFEQLGATNVSVAGTMKFDTASTDPPADDLPEVTGRLWVCGSTGPGEETLLLDIHDRLRRKHAGLRLVLVPRKPERFAAVAELASDRFPLWQRSVGGMVPGKAVILVDAMGELRVWYARAEVVFVGRSLVDLGVSQRGSDMIEPAALGRPTCVGPWTQNFAGAMAAFGATVPAVADPAALERQLDAWLADPAAAAELGRQARDVVLAKRGATARHVAAIREHLRRGVNAQRR